MFNKKISFDDAIDVDLIAEDNAVIEAEEKMVGRIFEGFTTISFTAAVGSVVIVLVTLFSMVMGDIVDDVTSTISDVAEQWHILLPAWIGLVMTAPFIAEFVNRYAQVFLAAVAGVFVLLWTFLVLTILNTY